MALHPLLDFPRFSRDDVLAVTGLSAGELKGILDRKQVDLGPAHYPGSGRPRLYTGRDVLKLSASRVMSQLGLPLRQMDDVARVVDRREFAVSQLVDEGHLWLAIYPASKHDWRVRKCWNDLSKYKLPAAVQLLDVDQLIDETLAKLQAVVSGWPMPDFDAISHEGNDKPRSVGTDDFYVRWTKDADGRRCLVGLSAGETDELREIKDRIETNRGAMNLFGMEPEDIKKKLRHLSALSEAERGGFSCPDPWTDEHDFERTMLRADELEAKHEAAWRARLQAELRQGAD